MKDSSTRISRDVLLELRKVREGTHRNCIPLSETMKWRHKILFHAYKLTGINLIMRRKLSLHCTAVTNWSPGRSIEKSIETLNETDTFHAILDFPFGRSLLRSYLLLLKYSMYIVKSVLKLSEYNKRSQKEKVKRRVCSFTIFLVL